MALAERLLDEFEDTNEPSAKEELFERHPILRFTFERIVPAPREQNLVARAVSAIKIDPVRSHADGRRDRPAAITTLRPVGASPADGEPFAELVNAAAPSPSSVSGTYLLIDAPREK